MAGTDIEPAPRPNCGHATSRRYVFVELASTWMCKKCIASIGPLYDACAACGRALEASSAPFRVERFCSIKCREGQLALALEG